MCEQQYFIEYVLGLRGPSNQKADKGTIVHKVLEILAFIKYNAQNNSLSFTDDIVGLLDINNYNLTSITDTVYNHYSAANSHHKWTDKDRKDCHSWVQKTLDFNNGMFDPRNRIIICPEQRFDITIKKPWAAYSFDTPDGKLEGYLGLKGTIDLITKVDDKVFEIIDWKTGKRLDWATGQEKTQEKLENDPQLRIYHYAVSQLYPDIETVFVTINFINDGGPFSIAFDKNDLIKTEQMLRTKFEKIKSVKRPSLHKSWMCNKLCHFGKTSFENSEVPPIIEYRDGQVTPKDKFMSKCEQIHHDIQLNGIDSVVKDYKKSDHSFGFYKAPGET
jgi:hypothetical protein